MLVPERIVQRGTTQANSRKFASRNGEPNLDHVKSTHRYLQLPCDTQGGDQSPAAAFLARSKHKAVFNIKWWSPQPLVIMHLNEGNTTPAAGRESFARSAGCRQINKTRHFGEQWRLSPATAINRTAVSYLITKAKLSQTSSIINSAAHKMWSHWFCRGTVTALWGRFSQSHIAWSRYKICRYESITIISFQTTMTH